MARPLRVLLYEAPYDPYYNLAFEEAFVRLRAAGVIGDDTLRIWRNENAVVIGYFQYAEEEVVLEEAEKIGAKIVRRFTGGGAVYHDLGNYNYAIALGRPQDIKDPLDYLYRVVLSSILKALEYLGLKPYRENINDIVVAGRKVSGTAATLRWGSLFLHGAILVSTNLDKLSRILRVPREKLADKGVSEVKYRVATLEQLLGRRISSKELIEAIVRGFEETLGFEAYMDVPSAAELKLAHLLYKRYSDYEWNYKRKPIHAYSDLEEEAKRIIESERR